jgi:phosphate starvation-inducible PhoH-like protein
MSKKRRENCECHQPRVKQLLPMNQLQKHYIDCINESPITIATGYPGTGKTFIPARIAAAMFKLGRIKNITLTRPNVSSSKTMGHYPGSKNEKMQNWLVPVLGALTEEFTMREINWFSQPEQNQITMCPLELVKGLSWDDTFVIVDEAEDLSIAEIKAVLTRIGNNSKIVLCGDVQQAHVRDSGLAKFIQMMNQDQKLKDFIGYVHFNDPSHIVRSPACREIILGFERADM